MAIEPSLVVFASSLYLDTPMSSLEVDELSALLDNREELFAYVLTQPAFIARHPDVEKLIRTLAREHGSRANTKREATGMPRETTNLRTQMRESILAIIRDEGVNGSSALSVDELDRKLVRYSGLEPKASEVPERWIESTQ